MTYYGSKELAASFRTVRANTIKIAEEIPESHYGFRAAPDTRSVAETLMHIALGTRFQHELHIVERRNTLVGYDFFGHHAKRAAEEKAPHSKAEILDLLRTEGEQYAQILDGVEEGFLAEHVEYPQGMNPPSKSRFEMMMAPKEHEMHHRGQLMLVQRILGITPHLTRQMQERVAALQAAQAAR
jgi:uncharacterized damage-inducible protein DinB